MTTSSPDIPLDPDLVDVTRISLRTELGRYEFVADAWEPVVEDGGRTLKFYGRGDGSAAKREWERARAMDGHHRLVDQNLAMIDAKYPGGTS